MKKALTYALSKETWTSNFWNSLTWVPTFDLEQTDF